MTDELFERVDLYNEFGYAGYTLRRWKPHAGEVFVHGARPITLDTIASVKAAELEHALTLPAIPQTDAA